MGHGPLAVGAEGRRSLANRIRSGSFYFVVHMVNGKDRGLFVIRRVVRIVGRNLRLEQPSEEQSGGCWCVMNAGLKVSYGAFIHQEEKYLKIL